MESSSLFSVLMETTRMQTPLSAARQRTAIQRWQQLPHAFPQCPLRG
jgi:hypothetical protein